VTRIITVGAAQLGPIQRAESRATVVSRMLALMAKAHARGVELIVFPELALTTFFPRMLMEDQAEVDAWFESEMPNAATQPLFDAAREYAMGFHLGYAELVEKGGVTHRYNTAILVDKTGNIAAKYRKIHLPGHAEFDPDRKFQHLRNAISRSAIWAGRCGGPSAASWAWRSATTGAGPRATGSWACKGSKWC
jgi:predicted amidohydrolase